MKRLLIVLLMVTNVITVAYFTEKVDESTPYDYECHQELREVTKIKEMLVANNLIRMKRDMKAIHDKYYK